MRTIIRRTVCTAESTTELRSAITHTIHNVVENRNPYRSINRRRFPEPTPVCYCLRPTICHVYQRGSWPYHDYCACVKDNYIKEKNSVIT
jgi:hypothetical protein